VKSGFGLFKVYGFSVFLNWKNPKSLIMYFAIKLLSPRPTFPQDITPEEIAIMQLHRAY